MAQEALSVLRARGATLAEIVQESFRRAAKADRHEWIYRLPEAEVRKQVAAIEQRAKSMSDEQRVKDLPLMGMTFGVKDNIALAGAPMTNGCDYRTGGAPVPSESAAAVRRLMERGAVCIGKTNLDCAATGLVGVRSAYGACQNSFDRAFISGGSSSGSAVSVATGQVSFALGTDTAGSGRVPAMLNNIVGLKASRGLISAHGVVPACKSLDCVSIFATTVRECWAILRACATDGSDDVWDRPHSALTMGPSLPPSGQAKFTFAIPTKEFLDFTSFGEVAKDRWALFGEAWEKSIAALQTAGGTCVEVDYAPFQQAAKLLYEGPWVAERYSALEELLKTSPDKIFPTVRKIVEPAGRFSAKEAFEAFYKLRELKMASERAMAAVGAKILVVPTAAQTYKIEEVQADPVALNSNMGRYTNHMNLFDLCGVAVPCTWAGPFPFGVTISAPAGYDRMICDLAQRVHAAAGLKAGAMETDVAEVETAVASLNQSFLDGVDVFQVAVSGAHMEGLPLNPQLTERGGKFVRKAKTKPIYKLVAFDGMKPPRPGMGGLAYGVADGGNSIEQEIWELPAAAFGSFMRLVAAPLGIGWIELEDGSRVQGFRLVDSGADRSGGRGGDPPTDITSTGGWRNYLASKASKL